MTAARRDDDAAAVGFVAFLALAAGGVGIVIAALAIGAERAWQSWRDTRGPGGGWTRHLEDQRAWLDADRARLDDWRAKRRAWWAAGADPATEPARPTLSTGRGPAARRAWAAVALIVARVLAAMAAFRDGARDGWAEAREVQAAGGSFLDIIGAEPDPRALADPADKEPPVPSWTVEPVEPAAPSPPAVTQQPDPQPQHQPDPDTITGGPAVTTATPTQGETNLDYTAADLAGIQAELTAIEEHNDALAARRNALQAKIAVAQERVDRTGGTIATAAALDAARSVAEQLGQQLAGVADSTAAAADATQAAHVGLTPARDAQDTLHASGARGEFVDTATSD